MTSVGASDEASLQSALKALDISLAESKQKLRDSMFNSMKHLSGRYQTLSSEIDSNGSFARDRIKKGCYSNSDAPTIKMSFEMELNEVIGRWGRVELSSGQTEGNSCCEKGTLDACSLEKNDAENWTCVDVEDVKVDAVFSQLCNTTNYFEKISRSPNSMWLLGGCAGAETGSLDSIDSDSEKSRTTSCSFTEIEELDEMPCTDISEADALKHICCANEICTTASQCVCVQRCATQFRDMRTVYSSRDQSGDGVETDLVKDLERVYFDSNIFAWAATPMSDWLASNQPRRDRNSPPITEPGVRVNHSRSTDTELAVWLHPSSNWTSGSSNGSQIDIQTANGSALDWKSYWLLG